MARPKFVAHHNVSLWQVSPTILTLLSEERVAVPGFHMSDEGSTKSLYGRDQLLCVTPYSILAERKHPHHLPVRYG